MRGVRLEESSPSARASATSPLGRLSSFVCRRYEGDLEHLRCFDSFFKILVEPAQFTVATGNTAAPNRRTSFLPRVPVLKHVVKQASELRRGFLETCHHTLSREVDDRSAIGRRQTTWDVPVGILSDAESNDHQENWEDCSHDSVSLGSGSSQRLASSMPLGCGHVTACSVDT